LKKSIWSKEKRVPESPKPEAPAIAIDIRLPEPAILTCAREIPLKIIVASTNGVKDSLTLQSLQIELISITNVRAQDVGRTERSSTVIMSRSNIGALIRFPEGSEEAEIDSGLWRGQVLPNSVPPSFQTCNISRAYELVARISIKYEETGFQVCFTYPANTDGGVAWGLQHATSTDNWRSPSIQQPTCAFRFKYSPG
jgi:hypothetical protein